MAWITKYRNPVLYGEGAIRVRDLIREFCKCMDVEIFKGHVSWDHLHLLLSMPPHVSVCKLVQRPTGKTSHKLLSEYKRLASTSRVGIFATYFFGATAADASILTMKSLHGTYLSSIRTIKDIVASIRQRAFCQT